MKALLNFPGFENPLHSQHRIRNTDFHRNGYSCNLPWMIGLDTHIHTLADPYIDTGTQPNDPCKDILDRFAKNKVQEGRGGDLPCSLTSASRNWLVVSAELRYRYNFHDLGNG